jgi:hypothetical protein
VGIGMRLATRRVTARLDWGFMLDAGVEGERWDNRVHFGVAVAF